MSPASAMWIAGHARAVQTPTSAGFTRRRGLCGKLAVFAVRLDTYEIPQSEVTSLYRHQ